MIKSPYNFVPLTKTVVFPDWADKVSHDIPFEDGESGTITVKLTAVTPVFVRDGHAAGETTEAFSGIGGRYFIPGSGIKGAVRNVFEILSFSKLNMMNDHRYAYRDLTNAQNEYMKAFGKNKPHAGWLSQDENGTWTIEDCGEPGRLSHKKIDEKYGTQLASYFGRGGRANFKQDDVKTAKTKYDMFGNRNRVNTFSAEKDKTGKLIASFSEGGGRGTIVFTGQPGPRNETGKRPTGKHLEFVFFERNGASLEVPDRVKKDFLFAYFDEEMEKASADWKMWKEMLKDGKRIPVFFRTGGAGVSDLGLSYLYKLPFDKRTTECLPSAHQSSDLDLTETVFGYIGKEHALKGRVQFSHAFAVGTPNPLAAVTAVLGGPKASYFPSYVEQPTEGRYSMYTAGSLIRGRKRYPVHRNVATHGIQENTNVATRFKPLSLGSVFLCKVRFHNMRKVEIGALLSALTFHDTDGCFHSIGMAKPLGYGKMKAEITDMTNVKFDKEAYLNTFESWMEERAGESGWLKHPSLTELLTMASDQNNTGESELEYMTLEDHVAAKNRFESLKRYSTLQGITGRNMVHVLLKEEKEKLMEKERVKNAALSGSQGAEIQKIMKMTNAELKDYIISDIPMDKKCALIDAYPLLKGGQKGEIAKLRQKGKGDHFNVLMEIEKASGKMFE